LAKPQVVSARAALLVLARAAVLILVVARPMPEWERAVKYEEVAVLISLSASEVSESAAGQVPGKRYDSP